MIIIKYNDNINNYYILENIWPLGLSFPMPALKHPHSK